MASGTISELYKKVRVENIEITIKDFYVLVKIMEQIGAARVIGIRTSEKSGRRAKIYEMSLGMTLNFFVND